MCKMSCKGGCCLLHQVFYWLVIVGALNWGLVGLGSLVGMGNWNVVSLLFSNVWLLEPIVYLLVGIGAVVQVTGCLCKTCKSGDKKGACGDGGCCGGSHGQKDSADSEE